MDAGASDTRLGPLPAVWARLTAGVRSLLSWTRFPIVAALAAVLLSVPTLWRGLDADDYHHRAAILGMPTGGCLLRGDIAHLYSFSDANPEHTVALVVAGDVPWWSDPLSALSQRVDYRPWPDRPWLMHLQSLAWLFVAVLAAGALYRRLFGAVAAAGLALLLFAMDEAHATPIGWFAQHNMLLAVFFGTLALVSHHRACAEGWRPRSFVAPGLFALVLLSGESGMAAMGPPGTNEALFVLGLGIMALDAAGRALAHHASGCDSGDVMLAAGRSRQPVCQCGGVLRSVRSSRSKGV